MFKSSIVDISTVKVLDRYIKSNEQYFLITDEFNLRFKGKIYTINFVISNKIEVGKEIISTNITMTDFKKILSYVPTVIESSSRGEKSFDIFSRLLRERIIFLGTEIDDDVANSVVAQLLLLE